MSQLLTISYCTMDKVKHTEQFIPEEDLSLIKDSRFVVRALDWVYEKHGPVFIVSIGWRTTPDVIRI